MKGKLWTDSDAIKQIFDYFRNVAIAGAVVGAVPWVLSSGEGTQVLRYLNWVSAALLLMVGAGLFFLNFNHGQHLLSQRGLRDSRAGFALRFVHGLFIFALFGALTRIDPHWVPFQPTGAKEAACQVKGAAK